MDVNSELPTFAERSKLTQKLTNKSDIKEGDSFDSFLNQVNNPNLISEQGNQLSASKGTDLRVEEMIDGLLIDQVSAEASDPRFEEGLLIVATFGMSPEKFLPQFDYVSENQFSRVDKYHAIATGKILTLSSLSADEIKTIPGEAISLHSARYSFARPVTSDGNFIMKQLATTKGEVSLHQGGDRKAIHAKSGNVLEQTGLMTFVMKYNESFKKQFIKIVETKTETVLYVRDSTLNHDSYKQLESFFYSNIEQSVTKTYVNGHKE